MSYRLAAQIPERVTAIAAIAGGLAIDVSHVRFPVSVIHFYGTVDEYVPISGGRGEKTSKGVVHRALNETIATWVKVNRASTTPIVEALPNLHDDGTSVVRKRYDAGMADVVLYVIEGGGHTWPGRRGPKRLLGPTTFDISANDVMWAFFQKQMSQ